VNVPLLQAPVTTWECEHCPTIDQTNDARVHTRMHACARYGGATIPMTMRGAGSRVRLVERQDYVGDERVQLLDVDGRARPVMAAVTEHADGRSDAAVFAPIATPE
jgi:hypothetical protein